MELIFRNVVLEDLQEVAQNIKAELKTPALVFLEGEVGAGKTTLIQAFNKGNALSPSYSIVNEYENSLHADFYRIDDQNDIEHLELSAYDEKEYFWIEWGERFIEGVQSELEGRNAYKIQVVINQDESRQFILSRI